MERALRYFGLGKGRVCASVPMQTLLHFGKGTFDMWQLLRFWRSLHCTLVVGMSITTRNRYPFMGVEFLFLRKHFRRFSIQSGVSHLFYKMAFKGAQGLFLGQWVRLFRYVSCFLFLVSLSAFLTLVAYRRKRAKQSRKE